MQMIQLPVLRPVPIATRGRSWWTALLIWWTTQRQWEVVEDYRYTFASGQTVIIPKGFIFNGATVPRPLRWLISPTGVFLIPSHLHDFAYTYNYQWVQGKEGPEVFPETGPKKDHRDIWDTQFHEAGVEVNGMGWLCKSVYWTLRLFGGVAWRASRRETPPAVKPSA